MAPFVSSYQHYDPACLCKILSSGASAYALRKYHDAMTFFHKASRADLSITQSSMEMDMEMMMRWEAARSVELCRRLLAD